jgi:glycosyltransferase involved in cell wall biosynthesis
MQKILCTVTNDLTQDQRMHRICHTMSECGYNVTLIGRGKPDSIPLQNLHFSQIRLKCWFNRGMFFYLEYNLRLFRYLIDNLNKDTIIYSVDSDTLLAGGIVKYLKGIHQIFDSHEYFTEVPELESKPMVRKVWQIIESIFVPKADVHITVSKSLADVLSNKFNKKFHTIMSVPLLRETQLNIQKADPPIIIYQGMLNQGRGIEAMIGAMEKICRARFYIIGEGDISSDLQQLAVNSAASDRIQFLGWKSHTEIAEITPKATLATNLLERKSESYYYSLANKFFDYIHYEVPSVNMAFPEYVDVIRQYEVGATIIDLDINRIADTINNLLDNPTKLDEMRDECKKAKKIYQWENEAKKLIDILSQLNSE